MTLTLSDHAIAILNDFRANGTAPEARRATIILMRAQGAPVAEIVAAVKLSESSVYNWLSAWAKKDLDIFPTGAPQAAAEPAAAESAAAAPIPGVTEPRLPLALAKTVGLAPDDAMSEAGRKVLLFHFERMLLNEPGSRLGEDIEAVHDMRVATRRMRSALRLFAPFFDAKAIHPYNKGLRTLARTLGDVRDLEVLIAKAETYAAKNPTTDISPLLASWNQQCDAARMTLVHTLDGKKYARFVAKFHTFLTTPGAGAPPLPPAGEPVAYQVRHIAPRLIYACYEDIRAYEPVLAGAPVAVLHALRIEFKRFRYALEFFRDVLGPEVENVISEVKKVQDHLGDLNDVEVALTLLRLTIDEHNTTFSGVPMRLRPDNISGVLTYAAHQQALHDRMVATFPTVWERFIRDSIRRDLALSIAAL